MTRERDGYHFEKDQVQTIAGAINTTHDFIGKIIRNYPVSYEAPKYKSAKKEVFDINTTYYYKKAEASVSPLHKSQVLWRLYR